MSKIRQMLKSHLLFDRTDRMLADYAALDPLTTFTPSPCTEKLHPSGIIELEEPRPLRIVRTVAVVLGAAGNGNAEMNRRIAALTLLRQEICEGLDVPLRNNTGRVLLACAKELLRCDSPDGRLRAAHDLRTALLGNPLFIRKQLTRFRLLEMPERELPVTFDYHVHDANTKGRKSPSHLIMDAWIKGIRKLQVIYYNFVPPTAAAELLRAAGIMGIEVRIGVEFRTLFRGSFVDLIWVPCGFSGAADFLKFLSRHKTEHFTRKCVAAADYRSETVLKMFQEFNASGRDRLGKFYGIEFPPVDEKEFLNSAPSGKPLSPDQLSDFLNRKLREPLLRELRRLEGRGPLRRRKSDRAAFLRQELEKENISAQFLNSASWDAPPENLNDLPEINRLSPAELIQELQKIASGFRVVLNLTGLSLESVIEILYDCRGGISTLEIYNLKDAIENAPRNDAGVNELRHALNAGNVVKLKKIVRNVIVEEKKRTDHQTKLRSILRNLPAFISFYSRTPLGVSIGSDSVGRASSKSHGMGMAVADTLGFRARRAAKREGFSEIPVRSEVFEQLSYAPGTGWFRRCVRREWRAADLAVEIGGKGNLLALGGVPTSADAANAEGSPLSPAECWNRLNSNVRIALKIAIGFLAAFLTFFLAGASTWWVLTWFGAVIWLGITLLRNIVQQRLAGGSFRSAGLLKLNDFISWQRIADSLLYTGLSVPLLEYVVKTAILKNGFGVTTETCPALVYAGIGVANGLYLTCHNLLRAFPAGAIWGNWLRVPLSIPLALGINVLLGAVLGAAGISGAEQLLQQWAAMISKFASDCIGGFVEATADRWRFLSARLAELRSNLRELSDLTAEVELLAPEEKPGKMLGGGKTLSELGGIRRNSLLERLYINALDFMYMWMRQPRAPEVLRQLLRQATPEERRTFFSAQELLTREKQISKLFLEEKLGKNFAPALAFYLRYYQLYLGEIKKKLPPETAETR